MAAILFLLYFSQQIFWKGRQLDWFNFVLLTLNYFGWVGSFHPHIRLTVMTLKCGTRLRIYASSSEGHEAHWNAPHFTILWSLPTFPLKQSILCILLCVQDVKWTIPSSGKYSGWNSSPCSGISVLEYKWFTFGSLIVWLYNCEFI